MQNPIPDTPNALSNTPMTDHDSTIDRSSGGDAIDFGYREVPRADKRAWCAAYLIPSLVAMT